MAVSTKWPQNHSLFTSGSLLQVRLQRRGIFDGGLSRLLVCLHCTLVFDAYFSSHERIGLMLCSRVVEE